MAGITVHKDRICRSHDTVAHNRVPALLEIQVSADMIDDNEILVNTALQMRDRFVQAHAVKAALLLVGQQTLHVLEGTGHLGLAVPLHDRHVDQKIDPVDHICDLELHAPAVDFMPFFLLCIDKRHTVLV